MKEIGADEASIQELGQMGIMHSDAVACLKACNGNLARAAEYYWNGDLEKARNDAKWSEDLWSAPREGPSLPPGYDSNFSQFEIQSEDVLAPGVFEPKSRPPSRISNRIDLTVDENDPELARALAASMQDSSGSQSGYSQQETGITGTRTSPTNSNFRDAPLNQEYDPSQWALTTTQTVEIFLEPSPGDRKRFPGEPAFLKPSGLVTNLSAALTILHSIPIARESLLVREHFCSDYGHDDQWWNGQNIRMLRIINIDDEASQIPEEFVEVQRLMAFLDQTTRAYGSVDALAAMQGIRDGDGQSGVATITSFFQGRTEAVNRAIREKDEAEKYTKAFVSHATQRALEGVDVEEKHVDFQVLDLMALPNDEDTFYDALDRVIGLCEDGSEVFVEFADVVCIRITPETSDTPRKGCRLNIPTVFYPDRYTEAWAEPVRVIKKQIEEKRCLIDDIEIKEDKLKRFVSSDAGGVRNPPAYEPKLLLEYVLEHLLAAQSPVLSTTNGVPEDIFTESQNNVIVEPQQDCVAEPQGESTMGFRCETPEISHMLKTVLSQLEKKLNDLSLQKGEARETFRQLKSAFTSPETSNAAMPPLTKYSLRGVCADSATVFALIPFSETQGASINGASPSSSDNSSAEQWWCLQWGPPKSSNSGWDDTRTASYEVKKVTEEEVLETVKTTGDGSLFAVYAGVNALDSEGGMNMSLPGPLQTFVDRDNAAFKAELQPTSPGRKRQKDWLDEDDEAVDMDNFSPKKMSSSSRSSATLGNVTPRHSRRSSVDGTEMEMIITDEADTTAGIGGVGMSGIEGGDISGPSIQLPPPRQAEMIEIGHVSPVSRAFDVSGPSIQLPLPHQAEMIEIGHVSPVVRAFHLDPRGRDKDIDHEMTDAEHVEYASAAPGDAEKRL